MILFFHRPEIFLVSYLFRCHITQMPPAPVSQPIIWFMVGDFSFGLFLVYDFGITLEYLCFLRLEKSTTFSIVPGIVCL